MFNSVRSFLGHVSITPHLTWFPVFSLCAYYVLFRILKQNVQNISSVLRPRRPLRTPVVLSFSVSYLCELSVAKMHSYCTSKQKCWISRFSSVILRYPFMAFLLALCSHTMPPPHLCPIYQSLLKLKFELGLLSQCFLYWLYNNCHRHIMHLKGSDRTKAVLIFVP